MNLLFLIPGRLIKKSLAVGGRFIAVLVIVSLFIRCEEKALIVESLRESSPEFQRTITLTDSLTDEGLIDSSLTLLKSLYTNSDSAGSLEDKAYVAGLLGKHYLYVRGKVNAAQVYLITQRDILETTADQNTPDLIRNYLDLSFLHVKKLELPFARSYAMMAHQLAQNIVPEDSILLSEVYVALGHVSWYGLAEEREQCLGYYHLARQYLPSGHSQQVVYNKILIGLINNFNNIPQPDSATFYLDQYFELNLHGDDALADYYRLYGICHYMTEEYTESASYLQKATALIRKERTPDPYSSVDAFFVLSAAYQYDHNYALALESIDSALIKKFGSIHDGTAFNSDISSVSLLSGKAEILADLGFNKKDTLIALQALKLFASIDTIRRNFIKLDIDTYLHQQFYDNYYYAKRMEIYAFLYEQTENVSWLHRMHDVITDYKAQGFARDKILNQLYHSPMKEEQSFQDFVDNDIALEEAIQADSAQQINLLLRQRQVIVQQVSHDLPEVIDQLINPINISSDDLLKYTREHQIAVVNYYIGNTYYNEDRIYVLLADNGQFKLQVLNKSLNILHLCKELYKLNKAAATSSSTLDTTFYYTVSYELYKALLLETTAQLDDAKTLVMIPDQILHSLPFEGLVTNAPEHYPTPKEIVDNSHYLIQDLNITYVYSPNDLMLHKTSIQMDHPLHLLAMAFSSKETIRSADETGSIQELNSSYRELQILEQLYSRREARYFYGNDCTKRNFLKFAHGAEIIHVSTHGAYDPEDRTSSMLYLRNQKGIEKLYPYEIRYGDIHPKLLVLSACDSGAGKASIEEGMFSIGRTFRAFGAEEVISALWPLSGNASAEFSELFYTHLLSGENATTALRNTKLTLIKNSKYSLPGYWSALIHHI